MSQPAHPDGGRAQVFLLDGWIVRSDLNRICREGSEIQVEPRVMQVLLCLADRPGEVITRLDLLDMVWNETIVGEEVLTRAISELRRLFADDSRAPRVIETIRHRGYRLVARPEVVTAGSMPDTLNSGIVAPVAGASDDPLSDAEAVAAADPELVVAAATAPAAGRKFFGLRMAVLALAVLALVTMGGIWFSGGLGRRQTAPPQYQGPLLMAEVPFTSFPGNERHPAISPDGTKVAFSWDGGTDSGLDIYIKQRDSDTPLRLSSDPAWESFAAWSPDGSRVVFVRGDDQSSQLVIVPAIGGAGQVVHTAQNWIQGVDWSPDGSTLAFSARGEVGRPYGIQLLDLTTRHLRTLTEPDATWSGDYEPRYSPDGSEIGFIRYSFVETGDLHVVSVATGAVEQITRGQLNPRGLDWSGDGRFLVFAAGTSGIYDLWRVRRTEGQLNWIPTRGDCVWNPSLGPEASMVFERLNLEADILRIDIVGTDPYELQTAPFLASTRWESDAQFSSRGDRVTFTSARSGSPELWVSDAAGSEPHQLTLLGGAFVSRPRWSPDDVTIAFNAAPSGYAGIYLIDADGGAPWRVTDTERHELLCDWSRDGRWLYFAAARDGTWEIYRKRPDGSEETQITSGGGIMAQEDPSGQILFVSKPADIGIWAVSLTNGEISQVLPDLLPRDRANWAVREDGIYYLQRIERRAYLSFFSFASRQITPLTSIPDAEGTSLSVSPDGMSLLYSRQAQREGDLVRVSNLPFL